MTLLEKEIIHKLRKGKEIKIIPIHRAKIESIVARHYNPLKPYTGKVTIIN